MKGFRAETDSGGVYHENSYNQPSYQNYAALPTADVDQ